MEPKTKAGLAAGAAIAALGLAGYLGYTAMGGSRTVRSAADATADADADTAESAGQRPRRTGEVEIPDGWTEDGGAGGGGGTQSVELEGPPPAWMEETRQRALAYADDFEFPDADRAVRAFEDDAENFALRAESDDALEGLSLTPRRGLVGAYRAMIGPLVAGDRDAFERALRDLGAPDPEGGLALYDRLAGYFEGSRVALSAARLRTIDPAKPGALPMGMPDLPNAPKLPEGATAIPMMVGVMEIEDDEGESLTIREVNIPLDGVFPGARRSAVDGARTAEVWAPAQFAKTRGAKADIGPSIFFVYDEGAGSWTPVAMRVALASESAASKLESFMRSRRNAVED